ncbi:unnamed protein product [Rangifer tarandus platyrhynchus]|uniref:Uncharacterized protein n=2 Tax=Rangifer tarandus platyrhynchus TaxID=3082113 RepID=A0AC59YN82_RANTA|nr:unnamed protein product [Rangifer tarandus platyrhynchus]
MPSVMYIQQQFYKRNCWYGIQLSIDWSGASSSGIITLKGKWTWPALHSSYHMKDPFHCGKIKTQEWRSSDMKNRPVVAKGRRLRESWSGRLGLADASFSI